MWITCRHVVRIVLNINPQVSTAVLRCENCRPFAKLPATWSTAIQHVIHTPFSSGEAGPGVRRMPAATLVAGGVARKFAGSCAVSSCGRDLPAAGRFVRNWPW